VLAERARNTADKTYIKQTIEKVFGVKINEKEYYETFFSQKLEKTFEEVHKKLVGVPKIIASKQLKRLAVLVYKCLLNKEPVLLVGETGVGKTVLC
jgi:midasin